jgi:hypothetical protein
MRGFYGTAEGFPSEFGNGRGISGERCVQFCFGAAWRPLARDPWYIESVIRAILLLCFFACTIARGDTAVREPTPLALEGFAWIVEGGVQLTDQPDLSWGQGKLTLQPNGTVSEKIDALPAEFAAWKGKKVRAFNEVGESCSAVVTGFRLIGRAIPHYETRQTWKGLAKEKVADEMWKIAAKSLIGLLDGCAGAKWAQNPSLPTPTFVRPIEADRETRARVLARFRALPPYREIQKKYDAEPSLERSSTRWEAHDGAHPDVRVFHVQVNGTAVTWVSVVAHVGDGCPFSGDLWALFEQRGKKFTLRNQPGRITIGSSQIADVDRDGIPEILFQGAPGDYGTERGLIRAIHGLWDEVTKLTIPYYDCTC